MPKISDLSGGLHVAMFYNDHNPPHFHIVKNGRPLASVNIATHEIVADGDDLRAYQRREIEEWTHQHQKELESEWDSIKMSGKCFVIRGNERVRH